MNINIFYFFSLVIDKSYFQYLTRSGAVVIRDACLYDGHARLAQSCPNIRAEYDRYSNIG